MDQDNSLFINCHTPRIATASYRLCKTQKHPHRDQHAPLIESRMKAIQTSSFLESVFLPFIEQIRLGCTQIHNLRTAIAIFFLLHLEIERNRANCQKNENISLGSNEALLGTYTFSTIISIRHTRVSADDATSFETSVVAFVTGMHQCVWINKRVLVKTT